MKRFLSLIVVILLSFEVFSCDVCGGTIPPGTQGLLPGNQFHFVGIRSYYSQYASYRSVFQSNQVLESSEHFLRFSILGRWQVSRRFDITTEIPIAYNWQHFNGSKNDNGGLADVSLRVNYLFVNKKDSSSSHQLRGGLGAKFPTGAYSNEALETSNLFPGTGSYDGIIGTNYIFLKDKWGWVQENQFVLKTANSAGYKYGHSFSSKLNVFLNRTVKQTKILPFVGIDYRWNQTDQIDGIDVSYRFNSGRVLAAEAGINIITNKWMLGARYSHPILQQLSNGDVVNKIGGVELSVNFLIQKK